MKFRAGGGAVVLDGQGRALALERSAIAGAWQLPQHGIEDGEVGNVAVWLGYELPADARSEKTGRRQVHRWFLLRARRDDLDVRLDETNEQRVQAVALTSTP